MKATELLKKDHNAVKKLFTEFGKTTGRAVKKRQALVDRLAQELDVHARIEEEIFYPAVRRLEGAGEVVQHALQEHEEVKQMIAEIRAMAVAGSEVADKVKALRQAVQDHVSEEGELFERARQLGDEELERLGQQLDARKQELAGPERGRTARKPRKAA